VGFRSLPRRLDCDLAAREALKGDGGAGFEPEVVADFLRLVLLKQMLMSFCSTLPYCGSDVPVSSL
jgi:hypothetical protein